MLSPARTVLSLDHSLSPSPWLSLSLPPRWLMANAALVHLYIPPHPSLANRCEILDMAWIWLPGEKGGFDWIGEGNSFHLPQHPYLLFFSFFDFLLPWCAIDFLPLRTLEIAHTCALLHFVHQEKNVGQLEERRCTAPSLFVNTSENCSTNQSACGAGLSMSW